MTKRFAHREQPDGPRGEAGPLVDTSSVLGAVRDDIRQTLRTSWLDPTLEAAAGYPVFFTAAWSAIRPNIGKSFLLLTRALRTQAVDSVRTLDPPDLRKQIEGRLSEEELRRVEESARAAHLAAAKAQVVVHALHRAVRRERIAGTGREEPPIRRGVPDWQRWMSLQPIPEGGRLVLDEAVDLLSLPAPPAVLRLLVRWRSAVEALCGSLRQVAGSDAWEDGASRLRRIVLTGITTLPHPVDLQWPALAARGFTEEGRQRLADVLAAHDGAAAAQTLMAAYCWAAFGAPDIGVEG